MKRGIALGAGLAVAAAMAAGCGNSVSVNTAGAPASQSSPSAAAALAADPAADLPFLLEVDETRDKSGTFAVKVRVKPLPGYDLGKAEYYVEIETLHLAPPEFAWATSWAGFGWSAGDRGPSQCTMDAGAGLNEAERKKWMEKRGCMVLRVMLIPIESDPRVPYAWKNRPGTRVVFSKVYEHAKIAGPLADKAPAPRQDAPGK